MRAAAVLILVASMSSAAAARELVPAERRELSFEAKLPVCEDPAVLAKVASGFAEKEAKFWNSSLTILEYEKIRPLAWRPWGLDTIPRRFCTGVALVSDGRKRRVEYSVREDLELTLFGMSWGVEWCVAGLDRNWSDAPTCRTARP